MEKVLNHDGQWHVYNPEIGYDKKMLEVETKDGTIVVGWPNAGGIRDFSGQRYDDDQWARYRVVSLEYALQKEHEYKQSLKNALI